MLTSLCRRHLGNADAGLGKQKPSRNVDHLLAPSWQNKYVLLTAPRAADALAEPLSRARDELLASLTATLDARFASLARELEADLDARLRAASEEASLAARRRATDGFNQAVRRLRQARSTEDVSRWLIDAAAPFSPRGAVFSINGVHVQGLRLRGVDGPGALQAFEALDLPLAEAPLFAHCLNDKEPVIGLANEDEVSPAIAAIFRHDPAERVYLMPLLVRGEVAAIFYAAPGREEIDLAALELLTQCAAAAAEALLGAPEPDPEEAAVEPPPPGLVQIEGAAPPEPRRTPEWSDLSGEEQELHLNARRFARVHVAEMRLYHAALVESGRISRRIYLGLRNQIDKAREEFRQRFVKASPGMVDYLHQELVRSLAHDDTALLGRDYPGPLC